MNKKQLIVTWMIGSVITLFISGCATMSSKDKSIKNNSSNVRVSGDVTVSAIDRRGL